MIFGYARVSTKEQNLNLQADALKKAGCERIFQEKVSGRSPNRPELLKLLEQIRPGDTLIVFSVDRLGRTTRELIILLNDFKEKGITFKSLSEGIFDTSSPMGEAIFQIIAILKSMEVNVLRERTIKGIEAARARGVNGGRPTGSYNKKKASAVVTLYKQKNSINFIEDNLNISRSTIYQYLRKEGVMVNGFKKSKLLK
jgi:DNA invertase Pin-like site-specific DNA recombinase